MNILLYCALFHATFKLHLCNLKSSSVKFFRMEISNKSVGQMLKEAREQSRLTQEQLAQKVGKKRSYISKLETEYGNNIKLQTLKEIVEKGFEGKIKIDIEL
ncbi:XRE family transcriptional regulator [Elizabethkingia anophelis]|nr:XRE family transcriptional regulator [Elizabethkingia anophelis]AVF52289.1 XRE family transcriptional regulator [Elizabethkingia anophelis]MBG0505928.1 helix-turn-helix domain-containing protein [Elizabethkingia anophelis]MCT3805319.1 helix-turn-helix domain-containing protein [Elizabethkingia anophelis]MCT3812113.1 helix-turn-helix domain-containing protein [Elizabethkingia anophelis]